ncbi:MAG: inositol-3-phosphate synthase, partial [Saprospiraceae bacterium]|nr:inositol-3-phosphate synthase [Saprospiraceae bacterium]
MSKQIKIKAATGKLGVLTPGMGAVATTFIAGVIAARKGIALPIGSLTQMGTIRLGKRTEDRNPRIKDFAPLANLDQIVFGGWDVYSDNVYEAALEAKVLERPMLEAIKDDLQTISPMKAVFDKAYVRNLDGT